MEENREEKRKRIRRKGLGKINWLPFIGGAFLIYLVLQIYLMGSNRIDTVKATEGYINDSIISPGIVCRSEIILTRTSRGSVDYLVEDGRRVSKGYHVATVYPGRSDVSAMKSVRDRQKMLDDVNAAASFAEGTGLDISVTRKQLTKQLSRLSKASSTGDFSSFPQDLSSIILSLNRIGVATGRSLDFSGAVSLLQSEIDAVTSSARAPTDELYASQTGYFLSFYDGYEDVATTRNFLSIDRRDGKRIIESPTRKTPDASVYGKIITDYKWSVCTYVDSSLARNMSVGDAVDISLDANGNEYHRAIIKSLKEFDDSTLVIAECSMMDSVSATARIVDCEILFKQYKGIKIPKTAIKFSDGQMGVYINFSNIVEFKKISPVYEDENYVIVPLTNDENNQVKLYDSIIVKGRNLYDGKYI